MKSDLGIDEMSTLAKSASGGIVLIFRATKTSSAGRSDGKSFSVNETHANASV